MRYRHSGFSVILVVSSIVVVGAAATLATVSGLPSTTTTVKAKKATTPAPAAITVLPTLGLSPEALAAADVTPIRAAEMLTSLQSYLNTHWQDVQSARVELDSAQDAYDYAASQLSSAATVDGNRLSAANTRLSNAQNQWQTACTAARSAALGDITGERLELLNTIFANRHHDVPVKYMVMARTAQQWLDLEQALKATAYNESRGEANPSGLNAIITAADTDTAVAAAATRIVQGLPAIQQAMH